MGNSKSTVKISGEEAEAKTKKSKSKKRTSKSAENGDVELDNSALPSGSVEGEAEGEADTSTQEIEEGAKKGNDEDVDAAATTAQDNAKESSNEDHAKENGNGSTPREDEDSGSGVAKAEVKRVENETVKSPADPVKEEENARVENGVGESSPSADKEEDKSKHEASFSAKRDEVAAENGMRESASTDDKEEGKVLTEKAETTPAVLSEGASAVVVEYVGDGGENGKQNGSDHVGECCDDSQGGGGGAGNEKSITEKVLAVENGVHSEENGESGSDSKDEQVLTEAPDAEPAATIGSVAYTSTTYNNDDTTNGDADESSRYPPRLCRLCKWPDFDGYGFNLHAEKDKPGQYIGSVDADSPAETGGLKEGDRIIEVNGENIESQTHSTVISLIKSGGDRATMLVVDREADQYYKARGQTVSSHMASVVTFTTPARESETVTATVSETVETAPEPEPDNLQNGKEEEKEEEKPAEEEKEEEKKEDVVVAAVAEPEAKEEEAKEEESKEEEAKEEESKEEEAKEEESKEEESKEEEKKEESKEEGESKEEKKEDEEEAKEVEAIMAEYETVGNIQKASEDDTEPEPAVVAEQAASVESTPEVVAEQDTVEVAEVVVPVESTPEPEVNGAAAAAMAVSEDRNDEEAAVKENGDAAEAQEPEHPSNGTASNGINGGSVSSVPEPTPVAAPEPEPIREPEPAVIRSTTTTTTSVTPAGGDELLQLSAAEMKERLKSRKRQDPRLQKTSFEAKHKMFERM